MSIGELREGINSSEIREFLVKDTLTNYVKEGKLISRPGADGNVSTT